MLRLHDRQYLNDLWWDNPEDRYETPFDIFDPTRLFELRPYEIDEIEMW